MRLFFKHACDPVCIKRSIKVALVIGTILLIINHYDELVYGTLNTTNIVQIGLTYLVPYFVATFGSAMQARHIELNENNKISKNVEDTNKQRKLGDAV